LNKKTCGNITHKFYLCEKVFGRVELHEFSYFKVQLYSALPERGNLKKSQKEKLSEGK
jgi:hypothetical protein